jgi:hypothetical protein
MRAMPAGMSAWLLVGGVALLGVGLGGALLVHSDDGDDQGWGSPAEVVENNGVAEGWRTIEYQGVAVDLPEAWQRVDNSGCKFDLEHWGPGSARACGYAAGLMFFSSFTYDPAHGPGLRRDEPGQASRWSGYVRVEDLAVFVAHDDRSVARGVLSSARPAGG